MPSGNTILYINVIFKTIQIMRKFFFIGAMLFGLCFTIQNANAQLKVANNGNIGIHLSDNTNPLSYLSIGAAGQTNTKVYVYNNNSSIGSQYGIYARLYTSVKDTTECAVYGYSEGPASYLIGVKGEAISPSAPGNISTGYTYGVYGKAGGSKYGRNYGVYGIIPSGTNNNGAGIFGSNDGTDQSFSEKFAGFFRGKTKVNGDFFATTVTTTSDARLKTNIVDIQADALQKVSLLHPVQFSWQQAEDVITEDGETIRTLHFSDDTDFRKQHYGFLAQDVQKLFPELVQEDGTGYLGVNYMELIPLLVQAVQELSSKVEELQKSEVANRQQRKSIEQAILYQNKPNPFSIDTNIEYVLPQSTNNAILYIYNMNGLQVAEYPISSFGTGSVVVTAGHLEAGTYLYSLVADGQIVDTKRMILTK